MDSSHLRERLVPTLMVAGVISLLLSLLLGGFIVYQWVLASEATATSLVLLAFYLRSYRLNRRKSKWPPLLVIVTLLASVIWFVVSSWQILRASRHVPG